MTAAEAEETSRNREAPRVGRVGRMLGDFHFNGAFWLRCAFATGRMPAPVQWSLVQFFAHVVWLGMPSIRRTLRENHGLARGGVRGWWRGTLDARRTLIAFAWCMLERSESLVPARWARFEHRFVGTEHWHAAGADTGAAILLTAHVGGWEVGSLQPVVEQGRALHLVREEERTAAMQQVFEQALEARGDARYVTHFAADNPDLGLELLEALQAGDLVALQGDRPRTGGGTIEVELFGQSHPLPEGPFVLARMTGAPILAVFTLRTGRRRYAVRLFEGLVPTRTRDRAQDQRQLAQAFAARLEEVVRAEPDQWFRLGGGDRR